MNHIDRIKHVYERYAAGDAAGVLAAFAPNIEFRLAEGHPYRPNGAPWVGAEAITQNFFMKAGTEWDSWKIVIVDAIDMGDAAVVECRYTGLYKPTGRTMDLQVCHVWRFAGDQITSFHQYLDTARLHEIMGYRGKE